MNHLQEKVWTELEIYTAVCDKCGQSGPANTLKMETFFAHLATLLFSFAAFADDETNFAAAPPGSWPRFNPLNIATFNFTGANARLASAAPPLATYQLFGPARLALFGPTTFTQTVVSVDLVTWGPTRNVPGVIARAGSIGLGTTRGYSFGVIPSSGEVAIHRVTGEIPTLISAVHYITVTPGHSYRIVLVCAGSNLTGRIYDLTDLANPMIEVNTTDTTYSSGTAGILNAADSQVPIDVTFDNYLAWDGTPPPLTVSPGAGTMLISANALRSLGTNLETTDDLTVPFLQVYPGATINGTLLENTVLIDAPQRFYRRKLLGAP